MEKNDLRTLSSDWYFIPSGCIYVDSSFRFELPNSFKEIQLFILIPGSFLTESKTIKLTYVEEEGICGEHGTKA